MSKRKEQEGPKLVFDRQTVDSQIFEHFKSTRHAVVNSDWVDLKKDKELWKRDAEALQLGKSLLRAQADFMSGTYDTFKLRYGTIDV